MAVDVAVAVAAEGPVAEGPVASAAMSGEAAPSVAHAAASPAQAVLDDQGVAKISPAAKALESIIAEGMLAAASDGAVDAKDANTSASADSPLSIEEVDYTPSAAMELDDVISPRSTVSLR